MTARQSSREKERGVLTYAKSCSHLEIRRFKDLIFVATVTS